MHFLLLARRPAPGRLPPCVFFVVMLVNLMSTPYNFKCSSLSYRSPCVYFFTNGIQSFIFVFSHLNNKISIALNSCRIVYEYKSLSFVNMI